VFALKLSIVTSFWATVFNLLFGLLAAYVLSRYMFWGRTAIIVTISLPTAIPTAVAGFALLLLWGKYGMIGQHLSEEHQIMFTPYAIIVANIFVTHDQEEALEMGDRIAVINAGRIEQIGTPHEVYNKPETEFVATFLGAANLLLGVVSGENLAVGSVTIAARQETERFSDGQSVKLVFRPEDVYLSDTGVMPEGCRRLTNGVVEEISFVGA
ncbi:MAG: hypothetical protein LC731_08855, partial [Acidobacteria bacterium]|nr:hypothetical protein [Acidobacteriota bacterium]